MQLDGRGNFAKGRAKIGETFTTGTLSILLEAGDGGDFPDPASVGAYNATVFDSTTYSDPHEDPNREIIRVTAKSTDTLTITRAQESTSDNNHDTTKTVLIVAGPAAKMYDDIENRAGLSCVAAHRNGVDQTIGISTWETVQLTHELFDLNSDFNTSTYTYTAPRTQILRVTAMVTWVTIEADAGYYVRVLRDGSTPVMQAQAFGPKTVGSSFSVMCTGVLSLASSQTLVMQVWQDEGTGASIQGSFHFTQLSIDEVAPRIT